MKSGRLIRKRRARDYSKRLKTWPLWLIVGLLAAVFVFSAFKIGSIVGENIASGQLSGQLREINEQGKATAAPAQKEQATIAPLAAEPAETVRPVTGLKTVQPGKKGNDGLLPAVPYPLNKYANVSNRFRKLQQQNKDIIGWLTIEDVVDEGVVQRDNTYYLRRDYKGYHNQNGSIFMDENVALKNRPYTITLYGHNMKSGAMFGFMHHYEHVNFYHEHPFVQFDTAYEDGRYVIFAIGVVSTKEYDADYLNLSKLNSFTAAWRQEAIRTLQLRSLYTTTVDVAADDQILLLMTCAQDDTERWVIAARRIRDGETEKQLAERIRRTQRKAN